MKKKLTIISTLIASFFLIFTSDANAACLAFEGDVSMTNWAASGSIRVWCDGDSPPGPSNCTGSEQTLYSPGSFSLPNCSCLEPDGECLQVDTSNLPSGCTVSGGANVCGTNGDTRNADIQINCPAPTPAGPTPTPCWEDWYCENWKTPGSVPQSDPNFDEYQECFDNGYYASARKQCSQDKWEVECRKVPACEIPDSPTATPTTPVGGNPTATPTPPGGGGNPTATPTTPPGGPTSTPTPGGPTSPPIPVGPTSTPPPGGPTATPPPGAPTATPPPAPTPTPDFDKGMCDCDGWDNSPIIAGQNATFEAFGKVEGDNIDKARIDSISFSFAESAKGATTGKQIAESGKLNANIVEQSPNKVRYSAKWTTQIPQNVDPNKSYRVFADLDCQRNTSARANTQAVLAAEDENATPSFLGKVVNFFRGLIGLQTTEVEEDGVVQETEDATIQQEQIRLGTVRAGNVTLEACNAMYFEFPGLE